MIMIHDPWNLTTKSSLPHCRCTKTHQSPRNRMVSASIMATLLAHVASVVVALPVPPPLLPDDAHSNGTTAARVRQLQGSQDCPGTITQGSRSLSIDDGGSHFFGSQYHYTCNSVAYHLEYHGIGNEKPGESDTCMELSVHCVLPVVQRS